MGESLGQGRTFDQFEDERIDAGRGGGWPSDRFSKEAERFVAKHKHASIRIAEGMRTLRSATGDVQVRITIERPCIDLRKMELVDRTRIVIVQVERRAARS